QASHAWLQLLHRLVLWLRYNPMPSLMAGMAERDQVLVFLMAEALIGEVMHIQLDLRGTAIPALVSVALQDAFACLLPVGRAQVRLVLIARHRVLMWHRLALKQSRFTAPQPLQSLTEESARAIVEPPQRVRVVCKSKQERLVARQHGGNRLSLPGEQAQANIPETTGATPRWATLSRTASGRAGESTPTFVRNGNDMSSCSCSSITPTSR